MRSTKEFVIDGASITSVIHLNRVFAESIDGKAASYGTTLDSAVELARVAARQRGPITIAIEHPEVLRTTLGKLMTLKAASSHYGRCPPEDRECALRDLHDAARGSALTLYEQFIFALQHTEGVRLEFR